ncbi:hypothetical protein HN873_047734, partial [Arachis hypogaea]
MEVAGSSQIKSNMTRRTGEPSPSEHQIWRFQVSIMGYEGLEVVNPKGGTKDAVEEAEKGQWKQE